MPSWVAERTMRFFSSRFLILVVSVSLVSLNQIVNAENCVNIDQCANGPLDDPLKQNSCDISDSWVNGNVNQHNGHWSESESSAYRLHLTGLENNTLLHLTELKQLQILVFLN